MARRKQRTLTVARRALKAVLGVICLFLSHSLKAQCGPPEYCARTDTKIQPVTRVPVFGPAGSVVQDPDFGASILRVSDANTLRDHQDFSFHTDSSSETNEWNTNSAYFYVGGEGGRTLLYSFDPANMRATYSGVQLSAPPLSWRAGAQFSHVNPDLIYGLTITEHPKFQQYDISRKRVTDVHDPASCVKFASDVRGHDIDVSANDNRLVGNFGSGQDKDFYIYLYDRKQGCRWYNTQTGEIGGQWGPSGAASLPERYGIHNLRISRDGTWVWIGRGMCYSGNCSAGGAFWKVDTLEVGLCLHNSTDQCGGHHVMGYTHDVNTAGYGDPFNVVMRPLNSIHAFTPLIKQFPPWTDKPAWLDKHWSWSNDNPTDTAPICGTSYAPNNSATPGALPVIGRPWENEILCIATDPKQSKVWRFAHHFSSATNGFFSTPRGNVSQDGRFFIFTSDWMNTLGNPPNGKGYRTDVFLLELK